MSYRLEWKPFSFTMFLDFFWARGLWFTKWNGSLPSFTEFYWVLLGFTGFLRWWTVVAVSFTSGALRAWFPQRRGLFFGSVTEFYRVLPSFTEFYRVLPSFTGFRLMATGRGERPVREKALGPRAVAMATALAFHLVGLLRRRWLAGVALIVPFFFLLLSSLIGCSGPAKADDETDRALVSYRVFFLFYFYYRVWLPSLEGWLSCFVVGLLFLIHFYRVLPAAYR